MFRDSIQRDLVGLDAGETVQVVDPDGRSLGWGLFEPEGAIAVRMLSNEGTFRWEREVIAQRVERAASLRQRELGPGVETCHRWIHGEGDGLPGLAVDRLGEYLLIYRYARSTDTWIDTLVDVLTQQAPEVRGIYLQDRVRPVLPEETRPGAALIRGEAAPPDVRVEEDGLVHLVDVSAPVSPGLFLDLREGRRWVEGLAANRRVLNLFSFTGALAMRAMRGGARAVTNVDAAARSHARCRQNLEASGLDPEGCRAIVGDVFKHLEKFRHKEERFELIIVDPPPFSRTKERVFSALKDWEELATAMVEVAAPQAQIVAISNASRLDEQEWLQSLGSGALKAGRALRLLGERGLPPDFPVLPAFVEGRYLRIKRFDVGVP